MKDQDTTTPVVPLSDATLSKLPSNIVVPNYDRSALSPGILHIGLGNFHRAHQSWYLHRLMQAGEAHDWAIIGAGVRAFDESQRLKMAKQDYLTTLILLDPEKSSAEVTGSMIGYVPIEDGNAPLIEAMSDPAIRIVALTVTEGGYYIDAATHGFDVEHEDIQHDAKYPHTPKTAFGAIIAALSRRRSAGIGPFTLQSCDNLQGNGTVLKRTVVSLAQLSDPDLAKWIADTCSFPNSMVDCIVPATGPSELALAEELGVGDCVPVTHEAFRQWVIEDDFCAGRPAWENVGATISDRVHDFEAMKIRILNGGHQIVANAGELLGVETIAECMAHPLIGTFFRKVANDEIVPHVHPVPDMSPEDYVKLIDKRFSNPKIVDTTRRVAFDGSSRHTGFIHPVIREAISKSTPLDGLALSEALWARMCLGVREDGSLIEPNDPNWDELAEAARASRSNSKAWLEQPNIYGDLVDQRDFANPFCEWLEHVYSSGVEAALQRFINI